MDLCSPYVVIRTLALAGFLLFASGLYFNIESEKNWVKFQEYNRRVDDWKSTHMAQFQQASFTLVVGRPDGLEDVKFTLVQDMDSHDGSTWIIPPDFRGGVLKQYTPVQALQILRADSLVGSNHTDLIEKPINISLIANQGTPAPPGVNGSAPPPGPKPTSMTLPAGAVTLFKKWPTAVQCSGSGCPDPSTSDVWRVVVHMCFVVSYEAGANGSMGSWRWRPGHLGCYGHKAQHGEDGFVLAR
jgi:hypothetical protein